MGLKKIKRRYVTKVSSKNLLAYMKTKTQLVELPHHVPAHLLSPVPEPLAGLLRVRVEPPAGLGSEVGPQVGPARLQLLVTLLRGNRAADAGEQLQVLPGALREGKGFFCAPSHMLA